MPTGLFTHKMSHAVWFSKSSGAMLSSGSFLLVSPVPSHWPCLLALRQRIVSLCYTCACSSRSRFRARSGDIGRAPPAYEVWSDCHPKAAGPGAGLLSFCIFWWSDSACVHSGAVYRRDRSLLVRKGPILVLDLHLDVINGTRRPRRHRQGDGLDKELHTALKTEDPNGESTPSGCGRRTFSDPPPTASP